MISTDAWLLHKIATSNNRFRVIFFTPDHGIIHAYYRSSRRSNGFLQAFSPLWLTCEERRQWHYVRTVETRGPGLFFSQKTLFAGLYLNEILMHGLHPHEGEPALYLAYVRSLEKLTIIHNDRLAVERVLRSFELFFLHTLGYGFDKTSDIARDKRYKFVPEVGMVQDENGVEGAILLRIIAEEWECDHVLKAAKYLMRRVIDYALQGRVIQTRALYKTTSST